MPLKDTATSPSTCSFIPSLNELGIGNYAQAGFQLTAGNGEAGWSVAIGDVNGDSYGDMLIGVPANNQAYLVLGASQLNNINLTQNALVLSGGIGQTGRSLTIGDVNGDNFDDMLIGALGADQAYLVLGSPTPVDIDNLQTDAIAIKIYGGSGYAGYSLAIGDVNRDGYGDMLLGAPSYNNNTGAAYLVLGSNNPSDVNLTENAILLSGGMDQAGLSVAVGDVNGDGYADILLGAPTADNAAGLAYLVPGSKNINNNISNINLSTDAFLISGGTSNVGAAVAIGNINGDMYEDILIGSPGANQAYLVLGSPNITAVNLSTDAILLNDGVDSAGSSVAIGDVNGDGYGDMLLGALSANQTYLVLGSENVNDVNLPTGAILLSGGIGDAGFSVAIGDVNGDSLGDMLIGAPYANQSYVVLGNQPPWLTSTYNSISYIEGTQYLILNPALQIHGNSSSIMSASIQITQNSRAAEDILNVFAINSNITALPYNTTTSTLTLTGLATVQAYQQALERVAYVNTAENPYMQPRAVSFHVNNGRLCGSNLYYQTINILPASPNNSCTPLDDLTEFGAGSLAAAGFQLIGGVYLTGYSVAIGDVNGDGNGDMLIGSPYDGLAYLVLGESNNSNINITQNAFKLNGLGQTGVSLTIGDVNGDNYEDMLVGGALGINHVYLVLGSSSPENVNLETDAIIMYGGTGEAGAAVAVGDVNGDGYGDMLIGAPAYNNLAGAAYLVLGTENPSKLNLTTNAILLSGGTGEAGALLAIGDVNGDGCGDMLLGAPATVSAYLVLGNKDPSNTNLNTSALLFNGGIGLSSLAIGDVNADGYGDILIGTPGNVVYLILGKSEINSTDLTTGTITLSNGVGNAGTSVSIGDINGDGYGEMLIGAPDANQAYLVLGSTNPTSINLSNDAILLKAGVGAAGLAVAIGDVNGDGLGDILLSSPEADPSQANAYIILGNETPWLASDNNSTTYVDGMSYVIINPGLIIQEDIFQIVNATIRISDNYFPIEDTLEISNLTGNITVAAFNTSTGILSLTGLASAADYQNALEKVTYINSAVEPHMVPRTITFQVNNGRLCGSSNIYEQQLMVIPSIPCSSFNQLANLGTGNFENMGFQLSGNAVSIGISVAVGDVNGDGLGDMLIGAPYVNNYTGAAYLMLGSNNPNNANLTISAFLINNSSPNGHLGSSVAIGDVNGDNYEDMLIGASNTNQAYLILGGTNPGNINLSNSSMTYLLSGDTGATGWSVAIGDVNGDGYGDMLIGTAGDSFAYLVLGSSNPTNVNLATSAIQLNNGSGNAGFSVAIGDVNKDGYGDMLIGAYLNNQAYLVLGSKSFSSNIDLSNKDVFLLSNTDDDQAGWSVAIGDVNGDGYGDMLLGAPQGSQAYLVLGSANPGNVDLSTKAAILMNGGMGNTGYSVAIKDINGDGFGDMLIGAQSANLAYLLFGNPTPTNVNLSSNNAIKLNGGGSQVGNSLAIGDVNGDGLGDILLGSPDTNQAFVVLGNRTPWLSSNNNNVTFTEVMSYVVLNPSLQVHENNTLVVGATIQITDNYQSAEDSIKALNLTSNITALPFDASTGTLTLTGSASASEYQTVLEQIAYVNSVDNPETLPRTITFQVDDGRLCGNSNQINQTVIFEIPSPTSSASLSGSAKATIPSTPTNSPIQTRTPSTSPSGGSESGSGSPSTHSALGLILGCSIGLSFLALLLGFYLYKRRRNPGYNPCYFKPTREHGDDVELFEEGVPINPKRKNSINASF